MVERLSKGLKSDVDHKSSEIILVVFDVMLVEHVIAMLLRYTKNVLDNCCES